MSILKNLNFDQKKIVKKINGSICVVAGPGSGKTRTLIHRVANMISQGINPKSILAVTFTNKATQEMRKRLANLLGEQKIKPFISTFHSFCAKLIRKNISKLKNLGIKRDFTIIDAIDQKSLIKKIYKELNISSVEITYESALSYISNCKMNNISIDNAYEDAGENEILNKKAEIYDDYLLHQYKNSFLDFDDLIVKAVEILKKNDDVRNFYSNKFKYISVDEFQDTNYKQYELLKLLCCNHQNILVVGDPDQNIFSWRGSRIDIILNFSRDFPNTETVFLNRNYRSTKNILDLASRFIEKNVYRFERNLLTKNKRGSLVSVYEGFTEDNEAEWIASKIKELTTLKGHKFQENLVLYRKTFLSHSIEHAFLKLNIPFQVVGGVRFFERKEIKTALSYLRFSTQKDDVSFLQIISSPKRGVGESTILNIKKLARKYKTTLWNVINKHQKECSFTKKQTKEINDFITCFEYSPSDNDKNFANGFMDLLRQSKYLRALKADAINLTRYENVIELIKSIRFQCRENTQLTAGKYLSDIALEWIIPKENDKAVQIMTIHKAKGLEVRNVFIMGLSDSIFPSYWVSNLEEQEEERRLFYVAVTRTIENLYLTFSKQKGASSFFQHIDQKYLMKAKWVDKKITAEAKVFHDIFGQGRVIRIDDDIATIDFFKPYGVKKIMANHKELKIIEE